MMPMRQVAIEIVRRLQGAGFAAYWVGGCVRDQWLGEEPHDYDVATSATPEEIERLFERTVPVGKQFGVMLVVWDDFAFQVATFRADAGYQDGRRPDSVHFSSAKEDAARRDFTINGLFYDPIAEVTHDWVGGIEDLRNRQIRTIGDPATRFAEDHLRLLRAIRFATQLDFALEKETYAALKAYGAKIDTVSAERVRDELMKLFMPPHAARGLDLLRDSGLLARILPEVAETEHCDQSPTYHPEGSVYNHIRLILSKLPCGCDPLLPWAVLLHDIGKVRTYERDPETGEIHFYGHEKVGAEMAEAMLRRLRFSKREIETVRTCVLYHMQFKDVRSMRQATLRRMFARPTFPLELELHRLDCLGSHGRLDHYQFLVEMRERWRHQVKEPPRLLTGHDLIAMGMSPGPGIGRLLEEIREKQLQDELATREEAIAWVRQQLAEERQEDAGKQS